MSIPKIISAPKHTSTRPKELEGILSESAWDELQPIMEAFEADRAKNHGVSKQSMTEMEVKQAAIILEDIDAQDGKDGRVSRTKLAVALKTWEERHIPHDNRMYASFNYLSQLANAMSADLPGNPQMLSVSDIKKEYNSIVEAQTEDIFAHYDTNKDNILSDDEINAPVARGPATSQKSVIVK